MLPSLLAVVLAVAAAWWSWRGRLDRPLARWAMLARTAGFLALLLLLVDPGIATRPHLTRPLVLIDNSVSMHAAGGRASDARQLAASLGDTSSFGELAPGLPAGRTVLQDALAGALSAGRAVIVVTDGEVSDASSIPVDLLAQPSFRVLPRRTGNDIALTEIRAPIRLTAGDTLAMEIDAERVGPGSDTATVVVRDSMTTLLHGVLHFGADHRAHLQLRGVLPNGMQGERWLRVERIGAPDAEADDDVRFWKVDVTPTPGVVVVAETPDWDSRALYRGLKDVVEVPIRGYVQLQRGQWRRMDDLRTVTPAEVSAAARGADLLAVRGDAASWQRFGKARLLWPVSKQEGDWYVAPGSVSPLQAAFTGVESDSLPPAAAITTIDVHGASTWVGATARLSRRGVPVPVIAGSEDRGGRVVTLGADGLYRWALRGGVADQTWRTMLANAASWLLAVREGDSTRARPVAPVTQRGRAVHFRWTGSAAPSPLAITLRGPDKAIGDTLRFDGSADAQLSLPVGRYRYSIDGGGAGSFAVEPYSDELLPAPVTVTERAGVNATASPRRSLRELLWLFAIAITGFGVEWWLRRRLGLR